MARPLLGVGGDQRRDVAKVIYPALAMPEQVHRADRSDLDPGSRIGAHLDAGGVDAASDSIDAQAQRPADCRLEEIESRIDAVEIVRPRSEYQGAPARVGQHRDVE